MYCTHPGLTPTPSTTTTYCTTYHNAIYCPKVKFCSQDPAFRFGRMPGFEPKLLRLQPGVLPMSYTHPEENYKSILLDFLRHCRRFSFHKRDFRSSLLRLRKSSLFVSSSLSVPNQIFSSFLSVGYQPLHYTLQGESSPASTATSATSLGSFNAASTF